MVCVNVGLMEGFITVKGFLFLVAMKNKNPTTVNQLLLFSGPVGDYLFFKMVFFLIY